MASLEVVVIHEFVQIFLQLFDRGVYLFSQGNAVEFIEDCLVKPFGVTISPGMLRPGEVLPDIVSLTGLLELVIGPGEVGGEFSSIVL